MTGPVANPVPVINPDDYDYIVFFTGAGMSAESNVPTYRGKGGIWTEYRWQDYACQRAFNLDPDKVLDFHEMRRKALLSCDIHDGHRIITQLQRRNPNVAVITQNIDGLHQRAGTRDVAELHGSLWRVRCPEHGRSKDFGEKYQRRHCIECGEWLRPDITWFEDTLDQRVFYRAAKIIENADLFISIGTSGVVYPAARLPMLAYEKGAQTLCINTEYPENDAHFHRVCVGTASATLKAMFGSTFAETND